MISVRDRTWLTGVGVGVAALVVGAHFATEAVSGVVEQRDRLQAQVGALQRRQPSVTVTTPPRQNVAPSPTQSPSPSSTPDSSGGGGSVVIAQRSVERVSGSGGRTGGGSSGGGSPSRPAPPSTPPAGSDERSCLVQLLSVCAAVDLGGQ